MSLIERIRRRRIFQLLDNTLLSQAVSPTQTITVFAIPTLTIGVNKTTGYVGDVFAFSGQYRNAGGTAIVGSTVSLYRNGTLVGSATTDAQGVYTINWVASSAGEFQFHAEAPLPP